MDNEQAFPVIRQTVLHTPTRDAWPSSTGSCSACGSARPMSRPDPASQTRMDKTGLS